HVDVAAAARRRRRDRGELAADAPQIAAAAADAEQAEHHEERREQEEQVRLRRREEQQQDGAEEQGTLGTERRRPQLHGPPYSGTGTPAIISCTKPVADPPACRNTRCASTGNASAFRSSG